MGLNWDFSKCPGWRKTGKLVKDTLDGAVPAKEGEEGAYEDMAMHLPDGTALAWGITESLIWMTMAVDIGWDMQLPGAKGEKALEEFVFRVLFYQQLNGPLLRKNGKPRAITAEEIRAHKGMYTNVATTTRKAFLDKMAKSFESKVKGGKS